MSNFAFRVSIDITACNTADELPTERSGGYLSALEGLIVTRMVFKHALGECVRIRSESTLQFLYVCVFQLMGGVRCHCSDNSGLVAADV